MSSGSIAGGSIAGVVVAFPGFAPEKFTHYLPLDSYMSAEWNASNWPALFAFSVLLAILALVASGKLFGSSHAR
jgi:hypothetical protein